MRSYYLDMFVKLFVAWVCCLGLGLIILLATDGDDDFLFIPILFGVACIIIAYVMFYALCRDLIDKKGYGDGEIPLLLIAFVTGPFVFFYMLALPSKNVDNVQTSVEGMQGDTWVCTCGGRNSNQTNICKKCGRTSEGKMTKEALQPEPFSLFKTWHCPKCGDDNPKSTRVCKGCGYEK